MRKRNNTTIILIGLPGAGKTTFAREYRIEKYEADSSLKKTY